MQTLKLKFFLFILMATSLLYTSCNKFEEDDEMAGAPLDGAWQSEGYGYLLDIRNGSASLYDITDISAIKTQDNLNLESMGLDILSKDALVLTNGLTEITFRRLPGGLPEVAQNGGTLPTTDAKANFDILWQTFEEQYAFFALHGIEWQQARTHYRPMVTEQNLYEVFSEMLSGFGDMHVSLEAEGYAPVRGDKSYFARKFQEEGGAYPDARSFYEQEFGRHNGNILLNYLNGQVQTAGNGQLFWGRLNDSIGYLNIATMYGFAPEDNLEAQRFALEAALDEALASLQDTRSLIIDVRFNPGGVDLASLLIASRFTDKKVLAFTKQARNGNGFTNPQPVYLHPGPSPRYTKSVVLLIGGATGSAAEAFTLMMSSLPQVALAGEPTGGYLSDALEKRLPNGWTFTLSNEVYTSSDGREYEKTGIPPDVAAPVFLKADRESGKDSTIDAAMAMLQ